MSAPDLPWEGGCRCGQVRFRVTAPPILTMACHCTGCQRMTGSAFSLGIMLPGGGFEVTQGEPVIGGLHGQIRHHFCPHCMSWVFTRPDEQDRFVNVRATMLDDATWFTPYMETFTSEKLPWAVTPAVRSFEAFPAFDQFEGLARGYAEQAAKPAV